MRQSISITCYTSNLFSFFFSISNQMFYWPWLIRFALTNSTLLSLNAVMCRLFIHANCGGVLSTTRNTDTKSFFNKYATKFRPTNPVPAKMSNKMFKFYDKRILKNLSLCEKKRNNASLIVDRRDNRYYFAK